MPISPTDELLSIKANLQDKGIELSISECWILLECQGRSRTLQQLADGLDISKPGAHKYVSRLRDMKFLVFMEVERTHYYRCPFDIHSETSSTTISFLINGRRYTFEELIGYLNAYYLNGVQNVIKQAMCHLHFRLMKASQGEKLPEPSPVDTKLFLKAMQDELLSYAGLVNQLVDLDIWDDHPKTIERLTEDFKHEDTAELIKWYNMQFQQVWASKVISRKGIMKEEYWTMPNLIETGLNEKPWENNKSSD